jgi:PEP-CTERM motif
LSLSRSFTGPAGGPMDFDVVITLTTPFFYNPAAGNLLRDVRNFGGGTTTVLDAESTTGDSIGRVHTTSSSPGGVNSPNAGHGDSAGLVTQFTYTVPEPAAACLVVIGAGLCCVSRQRRLRPPKL